MSLVKTREQVLGELRAKAGGLPAGPGVYLFKDSAGVVLYVGKAKSLRSRVCSYLQPSADLLASRGPEVERMIRRLVVDVDVLECDSEVDALLHENRLIKDIQPRFNERLKDDKSFPYLQITTSEDFPRVAITRQPSSSGVRLYGPFVSPLDLRAALPLMQRAFKFRTCKLDIAAGDDARRHFRPCILHSIKQCTAPCAAMVSRDDYAAQIARFRQFMESKGSRIRAELAAEMAAASDRQEYERAAELRDQLRSLEGLQKRGLVTEHVQPEVFSMNIDPAEGLTRLAEVLALPAAPRVIEGLDIAHLAGEGLCGSMVCFIDGRPLKSAYRRYRIKTVAGNDDCACIREVVWRRYKLAGMFEEVFPDVILIDGGKGQLAAANSAFDELQTRPPVLAALAKKEEELFVLGRDTSGEQGRAKVIRLPRRDPALRLLQSVRDEAHRFAQHYHHILRRKATFDKNGKPRAVKGRGKPRP